MHPIAQTLSKTVQLIYQQVFYLLNCRYYNYYIKKNPLISQESSLRIVSVEGNHPALPLFRKVPIFH